MKLLLPIQFLECKIYVEASKNYILSFMKEKLPTFMNLLKKMEDMNSKMISLCLETNMQTLDLVTLVKMYQNLKVCLAN